MRRLAWDGVAFDVPDNWELARYRYTGGGRCRLSVEDEYACRMEVEWIRASSDRQARRFMARAARATESLVARADRKTVLDPPGPGWGVTHCDFREVIPARRERGLGVVRHELVTAAYVPQDRPFRCLVRLHVLPGDSEDSRDLARRILPSFEWPSPGGGPVRWQVFDFAHVLDAAFALESTTFDIGSKLMTFRRGGRRLYLWVLSCADRIFTGGVDEADWVAGFLNGARRVPGVVFRPGPGQTLTWRHRGLLTRVHRDEVARWCFRHAAGFRRLPARNQALIWVFSHRRPDDLDWLQPYPAGDAPAVAMAPARGGAG